MKSFCLILFLLASFNLAPAQGLLNAPLASGENNFEFTGTYLGFQTSHNTVDPLWLNYDRMIVTSSGLRWRRYIHVGGEFGVPVYRANSLPRNSYFLLRVDLRLL